MVSRNIAQLESQCGERLFHRTGRGVLLTEFGEQLLPCVSSLIADAEGLADDIRTRRGKPVGEVVVGMLPSAVRRFAGTLFAAVQAQMPGVRLHLIEGASAQLEEQLQDGRLDMALVLRENEASIGEAYLLARLALHLIGPASDPLLAERDIALKRLSGLPLVVPGRPHLLRARLDHLAAEQCVGVVCCRGSRLRPAPVRSRRGWRRLCDCLCAAGLAGSTTDFIAHYRARAGALCRAGRVAPSPLDPCFPGSATADLQSVHAIDLSDSCFRSQAVSGGVRAS